MTVIAAPQAPLAALVYAGITLWSLRNELAERFVGRRIDERRELADLPDATQGGSLVRRFFKSPSMVLSVGAGVSFLTSASIFLKGHPTLASAFLFSGIGNSSLSALVNRQLGYQILVRKVGQGSLDSGILPKKLAQLLANPVVSFATCNMLFSAASPGAFSNPSQITALVLGGALGVAGIVRGSRPDAGALRSSLLYGAAANVAFGVNALLGGAFYSAAALGLWTLQNISAWNREASSVNRK